jgi:hypothetical protein
MPSKMAAAHMVRSGLGDDRVRMRNSQHLVWCVLAAGCVSSADDEPTKPDPVVADTPWSEELPADMFAVMQSQDAMQPAVSAVYEVHVQEPSAGFAGIAFEGAGITVYYRGEPTAAMQRALDEARRYGLVIVKAAAFSLAELESDGARIEAAIAREATPSEIQAVSFRYDGSGIDVERMPAAKRDRIVAARAASGKRAPLLVAEVIARAGVVAPVTITTATESIELTSRTADSPPWNGGDRWTTYHDTNHDGNGDVAVGSCTTGFGVNASGRTWILTAAHCASAGDIGYQGSSRMGPVNSDQWQYDLLLLDTPGWYLMFDGSPTTSTTKRVNSWGYHAANELLCQSGATSGTICGLKTGSSTNITIACCDSDGDSGYTIYGLIRTTQINGSTAVRPGDSGGPVFSLDGAGVRAKGTVSAGGGTVMYFQDWADVIRLFGAYPRTN